MIRKITLICLLAVSNFSYSADGYISLQETITESDWGFIPSVPASFKDSNNKSYKVNIYTKDYGVTISKSKLNLNLERLTYPKNVSLIADRQSITFNKFLSNSSIAFSYSKQEALRQYFDCYTFSSITLGSCDEATFYITNTNDEYIPLGDSIILIDGMNESFKISADLPINVTFIKNIEVSTSVIKNQYDWLSVIEGIKSPFLLNLTFNGVRLGDSIEDAIRRLPQRDSWNTFILGFSTSNELNIYKKINFIYELDLIFIKQDGYKAIANPPSNNIKFKAGFRLNIINNAYLDIFGIIYKNNLIGFENISFNQRTEHHFDKNFGELGITLNYYF